MKITFFGLTISSSWGNGHATPYRAILKALHALGVKATFFEKDVPYYARHRDLLDADYCTLHLYSSWDEVREVALREAAQSDVVVTASYLPRGAEISDELFTLSRPLRVFYDLDTPITLQNLQGQPLEYLRKDQIPMFDLYLSFTGGPRLRNIEATYGARMVRPLYGCVDPDIYHPVPARKEWRCDLSYMGTYAADRQPKVDELFLAPAQAEARRKFILAGSMYPNEISISANVARLQHVAPTEHAQFYASSRSTLNITRAHMAEWGYCPSGRFFEATACGTPVLTDPWDGLEDFFDAGSELIVVEKREDVVEAMQLADEDLKGMAARARQRTLDEHTGRVRAQQLLRYLEEAATRNTSEMEVAS